MQIEYPQGPKNSLFGLPHLVRLINDPLTFLSDVSCFYGGLAYLKFFNSHLYFVSDHNLIHQVFSGRTHQCERLWLEKKAFRELLGNGLAVSEGVLWQKQRRFLQPAFQYHRIKEYIPIITKRLANLITKWCLDVKHDLELDLMKFTLEINIDIIFGDIESQYVDEIKKAVAEIRALWVRRSASEVLLPSWSPSIAKHQMSKIVRKLDSIIAQVIQDKQLNLQHDSSLIGNLIQMRFDDGTSISDQQLRDEIVNLLFSGQTTTSVSIIWMLYLLAKYPNVTSKVYNEVDTILGARTPSEEDLRQLSYADMVIKETLRLYPPLFILIRQPIGSMQLSDYYIPEKNSYLIVNTYHLHRDSHYYNDPEVFIPERFDLDNAKKIPPYAYIPFGTGLHICIGRHLALLTIKLVLLSICQRCDFRVFPMENVLPYPLGALRPKHKLYLELQPRETAKK